MLQSLEHPSFCFGGVFCSCIVCLDGIPDPSNGVVMGVLQVAAQPALESCCRLRQRGLVPAAGSLGDRMLCSSPMHAGVGSVAGEWPHVQPCWHPPGVCRVPCPRCLEEPGWINLQQGAREGPGLFPGW